MKGPAGAERARIVAHVVFADSALMRCDSTLARRGGNGGGGETSILYTSNCERLPATPVGTQAPRVVPVARFAHRDFAE